MTELFNAIANDPQFQVTLLGSILGGLCSIIGSFIGVIGAIYVVFKQINTDKQNKITSDKNSHNKMLKLLSSELSHNIDVLSNIITAKSDIETVKLFVNSLELDIWESIRFEIIEFMDVDSFEYLLEGYRSLKELKLHMLEQTTSSNLDYNLRQFALQVALQKIDTEIEKLNNN